jgi:predicted phage tail protein
MIRKSGNRFSEKIMLKQKDDPIQSNRIMIYPRFAAAGSAGLFAVAPGRVATPTRSAHACSQSAALPSSFSPLFVRGCGF